MILQSLITYAERENLADPDFETVGVRWLIPLDIKGKLVDSPISLINPSDKNPRPKQVIRPFTPSAEFSHGTKSHFLCDTLERATLMLDPSASERAAARRVQHRYFQTLLEKAATVCPEESPRLQAVISFLQDEKAIIELHRQLELLQAKPSDNVMFAVDGSSLLDSNSLKSFWRTRRHDSVISSEARVRRVCIATSTLTDALDNTEKIKGVPGGLKVGTRLISFANACYCSFGLAKAQNSALSASAELKIRSALNKLIARSREKSHYFNETMYVHWTQKPIRQDPFDLLANADKNAVAALLKIGQAAWRFPVFDDNAYYVLGISGNGARIIVRDWFQSTRLEVERSVAQWFEDLGIVSPDGIDVKHDFKFATLLYGIVRAELPELSPQLFTRLLNAALRGRSTPLPRLALAAAIQRQRLDRENRVHAPRIALIKACLIRSPTRKETDTMTERLEFDSKDKAYCCGQMFAVICRLQLIALGPVGSSIADRNYGSVATRPGTALGPVLRKLQAYINKANRRYPGSGTNKQIEIENLCQRIEDLGGIPQTLSLEEQGRFALGYYCRLAHFRSDQQEPEDAPSLEEVTDEST